MKVKSKKTKSKNPINLDNEVIIGLNTKKSNKKTKKTNKPKNTKKIEKKNLGKKLKAKQDKKPIQRRKKHIKWLFIILLIIIAIVSFLMSNLFCCKKVVVKGNSKVSEEEIINLSGIKIGENVFRISNKAVKNHIKQNAYIDSVKMQRKLKGIVEINVKERTATYMVNCENGCLYINNQGYILENAQEPIAVPMIIGLKTDLSAKRVGERLENEDLIMLEKLIYIIDVANMKGLKDKITYFNIENSKNIEIYIDTEKKWIHFGDEKDASKKFDFIKQIIEKEKKHEGEIFIDNLERNPYFREKV